MNVTPYRNEGKNWTNTTESLHILRSRKFGNGHVDTGIWCIHHESASLATPLLPSSHLLFDAEKLHTQHRNRPAHSPPWLFFTDRSR